MEKAQIDDIVFAAMQRGKCNVLLDAASEIRQDLMCSDGAVLGDFAAAHAAANAAEAALVKLHGALFDLEQKATRAKQP